VRHLVVRSTSAVYGGSSKDPAIFTEETAPRAAPTSSAARDAVDIEGYVRGFGRRRPDVRVAMPRFAEIIGPTVRSPLTRYFSLTPAVPVALGHDARLQFVHEQDAVDLLEHLAMGAFAGIVNVAGDGTLTLAQAIHRAGRIPLPVPMPAMDAVSGVLRAARIRGFSTQQLRLLTAGRVLDTTRLRTEAAFACRYTTRQAFDDFARTIRPVIGPVRARAAEQRVASVLGVTALPDGDARLFDGGDVRRDVANDPATHGPATSGPAASGQSRRQRRSHLVSIDGAGGDTARRTAVGRR